MRISIFLPAFALTPITHSAAAQILQQRVASLESQLAAVWPVTGGGIR